MNKRKNMLILGLTFGTLFQFGYSSYGQTYNLEQLLKMADTANPSIRNAKLDIEINDKQKNAYLASRLPKVTAAGDYKYNAIIPGQVVPAAFFGGTPGTYSTVKFGVPYNLGNTVQLTQIIYNSQLNYGLAALDINKKIVDIQLKMTQDTLIVLQKEQEYATKNGYFEEFHKQITSLMQGIISIIYTQSHNIKPIKFADVKRYFKQKMKKILGIKS